MENGLEKFISANREAFDSEQPSAAVWENLEKQFVKKANALNEFVQANREAFDDEEPSGQVWQNLEKQFVKRQETLEQFIAANRNAFDTEVPGEVVWQGIEKTIAPVAEKKTPVIYRSLVIKFTSVAAAVLLVAVSVWYFVNNNNATKIDIQPVAQTKKAGSNPSAGIDSDNSTAQAIKPSEQDKITDSKQLPGNGSVAKEDAADEDDQSQEIFYYSRLTEIKFRELKKIEKTDPVLYRGFAGEIEKLDSNYHNLQNMLKGNTDKEAILDAMITNLKMQTEILSKQLYIIHSLKKSKQKEYENATKNI
ncbi:MAG TPA: hypothetical protein VG738_10235 [Chitinophagaceae bacterium]|nr:hypothetical protein [Chitinophagaceae bacterium]